MAWPASCRWSVIDNCAIGFQHLEARCRTCSYENKTARDCCGRISGSFGHGEITLPGGFARLSVPTNFTYLGPDDTETVLVKLWGNPPSKQKLLGLLMPAGITPIESNCWVVTIEYIGDGFVKDDDAAKINYADLLKQMQEGTRAANKARTDNGYPAIELVGWAAPPRYDAAAHKLYWAKELKVAGEDGNTLNYDIRMLGRHGVLVLSAVADMNQFDEIKQQTPQILGMVDFSQGSRYADFDPKVDKVAKYGLAALVAGGVAVAAKLGFFKFIWVGIIAMKKFIIIGAVAVGAWLKKLFGRGKNPAE
jgi:uncharacterized membrane-anchored protein